MSYEINNRVKIFIKSQGYSVQEFTDLLGLKSVSLFYNAFRGRNRINTETLELIAEKFQDVDMNRFFRDSYTSTQQQMHVAESQLQYRKKEEMLFEQTLQAKDETIQLLREKVKDLETTIKELKKAP